MVKNLPADAEGKRGLISRPEKIPLAKGRLSPLSHITEARD